MKKVLAVIFFILLTLALLFVWGAVYIWPEALEWLDPISTRVELTLILIGVPLLFTGLYYGWKFWRQRQKRLQQDQSLQYLKREKQRLNSSWKKLLKQLKQQSGGNNPYNLPWLLMLGDETSGKGQWLHQAGFELVQQQNGKDTESDGQHQNNDDAVFWVSEHAVVIELAGHFLEENTSELDVPVLQHLYSLLRQYRPRQPLSGVLVAQPVCQLIKYQPSWLQERARHLRRRLREIDTMTGLKLPVWLQVTRCDQLEGFQACFDQSCSNERSQPLGVPLPEGYQPEAWQQGFHQLHTTLTARLTDLLHNEKDTAHRQAISRFLLQLTLLQERLQISLDELYGTRHHAPEAWVAGVWFSSALQNGESYNLLASELGRSWGFRSTRQQPQQLGNNSYFIQSFFPRAATQILAAVGENPVAHNLWRGKVLLTTLSITLIFAGGGWVLWKNVTWNQQLQLQTQTEISRYQQEIASLGKQPELEDLISPLLRLRQLVETWNQPRPLVMSIGLFDSKEAENIKLAYHNQLQRQLFAPVAERVHDTLLAYVHLGDHHEIFRHLLHYLMLFDPEIRHNADLNSYITQILSNRGELPEGSAPYLSLLLDDIWATSLGNVEPDQQLITQARSDLGQQIDNQLIYNYIRSQPLFANKVDIRNRLGPNFSQNFRFKQGFEEYYLPYIFTREGFSQLDLTPDSPLLQEAIGSLNKVEGLMANISLADKIRASGKVRELYYLDYIRTWKTLISQIELQSGRGLLQQQERLEMLYQGQSPALFNLIAAISDQTQLAPPETDEAASRTEKLVKRQAERKAAKALGLKGANKQIATSASRSALQKLEKQRSAAIVNEAFSAYATFFIDKGTLLTEQLDMLNNELQQISVHPDPDQAYFDSVVKAASGEGSLAGLQRLARQERTAAGVWLNQLADTIWQTQMSGAANFIQKRWQATVYRNWESRLANHFPFIEDARREARLGDFVEFLRPAGELDQFTETYLSAFLLPGSETSDHRWRLRPVNNLILPLSSGFLAQLEQADKIQERYFSADGRLDISYRMRAVRLDSDITTFNLRDGNGNFSYSHGPQRWQERRWPLDTTDILSLDFASNNLQLARKSYSGPWAWQKFVSDSQVQERDSQLLLTYTLKSFDITLELDLDHRRNPFAPKLLSELRLPARILR
ncbi:type VI secretion system membrane subunit TssM [Spongorhabdus nitratireducens]